MRGEKGDIEAFVYLLILVNSASCLFVKNLFCRYAHAGRLHLELIFWTVILLCFTERLSFCISRAIHCFNLKLQDEYTHLMKCILKLKEGTKVQLYSTCPFNGKELRV